jgi:hypothetical protein
VPVLLPNPLSSSHIDPDFGIIHPLSISYAGVKYMVDPGPMPNVVDYRIFTAYSAQRREVEIRTIVVTQRFEERISQTYTGVQTVPISRSIPLL